MSLRGDLGNGLEAGVAERATRDPTVGSNEQMSDAAVWQVKAEPRLGGKLQRATEEVAYDVGVAHHDLVRVLELFGLGTMEVFAEGGFYAATVCEELLNKSKNNNKKSIIK